MTRQEENVWAIAAASAVIAALVFAVVLSELAWGPLRFPLG